MSWFILTREDLKTNEIHRSFCWQGEDPGDYVELSEEAVEELLSSFDATHTEPAEEEEEVPKYFAAEEPEAEEVPIQSPPRTFKDLMSGNKSFVDEDGVQQG